VRLGARAGLLISNVVHGSTQTTLDHADAAAPAKPIEPAV
jgi:hypothetical protein